MIKFIKNNKNTLEKNVLKSCFNGARKNGLPSSILGAYECLEM